MTDRPTDGRTDEAGSRVACTRLKRMEGFRRHGRSLEQKVDQFEKNWEMEKRGIKESDAYPMPTLGDNADDDLGGLGT